MKLDDKYDIYECLMQELIDMSELGQKISYCYLGEETYNKLVQTLSKGRANPRAGLGTMRECKYIDLLSAYGYMRVFLKKCIQEGHVTIVSGKVE